MRSASAWRCSPSRRQSSAGPETYGRLAAAFDWRSDAAIAAAATSRIDAWIDPPPYAGRPPVVIDFKTAAPQTLNIPEDSILVVRGDPSLIETRIEGAISPSDQKGDAAEKTRTEKRWTIHGGGKATILRSGAPVAVAVLAVTPAGAPTIASTEEPRANISGSLTLAYHVDDRFGLAGARADFARPHEGTGPPPRTLAPPPQAALQLPPTANGVGDAKTTVDLSEHPWAGAKVTMRLSAVSISGKTGQSGPIEMTLPQRIFHNPLARALVEQRRDLILDPDNAPKRVETALTGLAIAPELFDTPAKIYLGLKQANVSLHDAKSDADLLDVAAMLWAMAQEIENGDASQAERDLRAAEQALREALQRGASDQEIRKLMDQMREAAKRFMSEMARNSQPDSNAQDQNLQAKDLDKLLDQMEDTARNGSREDAQAMLDQMQEMFENMRSARDGEESPGEREMRSRSASSRSSCTISRPCATTLSAAISATARASGRVTARPRRATTANRRSRTKMARIRPMKATTTPIRRPSPTRIRRTRTVSRSMSARARCATGWPNCSASSRAWG